MKSIEIVRMPGGIDPAEAKPDLIRLCGYALSFWLRPLARNSAAIGRTQCRTFVVEVGSRFNCLQRRPAKLAGNPRAA